MQSKRPQHEPRVYLTQWPLPDSAESLNRQDLAGKPASIHYISIERPTIKVKDDTSGHSWQKLHCDWSICNLGTEEGMQEKEVNEEEEGITPFHSDTLKGHNIVARVYFQRAWKGQTR